jgi:hypothetical protein
VQQILARAQPGDAVLVKPVWRADPERSPDGWTYYLARIEPPPATVPEAIPFADLERACRHPRVWVFLRDRYSQGALEVLRARFAAEDLVQVSPGMKLHLFSGRDRQERQ